MMACINFHYISLINTIIHIIHKNKYSQKHHYSQKYGHGDKRDFHLLWIFLKFALIFRII